MDWFASGWPREGKAAGGRRAADLARRDVPTCSPAERVTEVAARVRAAGWDLCVVVDAERVVVGTLDGEALAADTFVEWAMREGPTTLRPHVAAEEASERFQRRDPKTLVITDSSGRLIGVLRRTDVAPPVGAAGQVVATD
jgi:CBS domain-containing protein